MEDHIILVDLKDRMIGQAEKLEAHRKGLLHRAFSVFLCQGERMLVQKRAAGKYHSGGLWANTCCSHPRVGEALEEAAVRRLREEAGIRFPADRLVRLDSFVYREDFGSLSEFEVDHILLGEYAGGFSPDPEEAQEMKWAEIETLAADLCRNPGAYAAWFITAFPMVYRHLKGEAE